MRPANRVTGTGGGSTVDRPDPHVFVLFGATGDLAKRKLFPGLYRLAAAGRLPEDYAIIGSGPPLAGLRRRVPREDPRRPAGLRRRRRPRGARRPAAAACRFRPPTPTTAPTSPRPSARRGRLGDGLPHADLPVGAADGDAVDDRHARPRRPHRRRPRGGREAVRHRPGLVTRTRRRAEGGHRARSRCTGSTTSWARRRCRTSWRCGSPTA